jgi:glucose dehydrogenase
LLRLKLVTSLHRRCPVLALGFLLTSSGCSPAAERPQASSEAHTTSLPARIYSDTAGTTPDDGQWIMPARDYSSSRYSGLNQITAENVGDLRLAWSFSTGVTRGHEVAPLVVGTTTYIVTPFPNLRHAFDLTKPGSPPKWTYAPKPLPAAQGVACCDVVNRGAAYFDGDRRSRTGFNLAPGACGPSGFSTFHTPAVRLWP